MAERILGPGEQEREPLWLDQAWDTVMNGEDLTWRNKFTDLTLATQAAADPAEHPWVQDGSALERRWKRVINHVHRINLATSIMGPREQPSPEDAIKLSLDAIDNSLAQYGWVTPGFSVRLLEGGFAWYATQGHTFDPIKDASKFDVIDVRDMAEPVSNMPDYETFKNLSDAEVEEVRRTLTARFNAKLYGSGSNYEVPQQHQDNSDALRFSEFQEWRHYGRPDREMPFKELQIRLEDTLANRRAIEPDFGKLPDDYNNLLVSDKRAVTAIVDYLFASGLDRAVVDTYSLLSSLGLSGRRVESLVANGILVPLSHYTAPDDGQRINTFRLSDRYSDYWWARSVTTRANAKSREY